ncbi:type VI secretion system baseplate subunit TssF [Paraburkholderia sediminicola]|uniref:type VI secretion system baseplate subunit TssF n=1 Tax=Paraburkholderia sediminicola TaxID=458836 RepID=UPI0038BD2DCA
MFNAYYEQELGHLRELAGEFAARNPALAPLLGAGLAADPDVERLLEGVAFLTGLVRQRLEDEFPEFIQHLAQMLYPQYLRSLPCMTIMQFQPKGVLNGTVTVPAGAQVASVPIDGARAIFRTTFPIAVEPVSLRAIRWEGEEPAPRSLLLEFAFEGVGADTWKASHLRLYLADAFGDASRLLLLLSRHVREIRIGAPGEPLTVLGPGAISMAGFLDDAPLLPRPANVHPAYALLHEYFAFPEKFLFVDIRGFDQWRARGRNGVFTVRIVFDSVPAWAPEVRQGSMLLNACPAVNLFEMDANPLPIDHRQAEYRLNLGSDGIRSASEIFDILGVRSMSGGKEITYRPFGAFDGSRYVYHLRRKPSPVSDGHDYYLSFPLAGSDIGNVEAGGKAQGETLSTQLLCTQGRLPEGLRLGDVCQPADTSPPRMLFRNIRPIAPYRPPPDSDRLLWRLLSHLTASHLRVTGREQLLSLLRLQVPELRDGQIDLASQRRIEGIEALHVEETRRFIRGLAVDGSEIYLDLNSDHFGGLGGMYLFGCVLDEFFGGVNALNTFSELTLRDPSRQQSLRWPARTGRQRLI